MPPLPERSSGQKFTDSIFSGSPYSLLTTDEGMKIKYLQNMDKHQESIERTLHAISQDARSQTAQRVPSYIPSPEILIAREGFEKFEEIASSLWDVVRNQQTLVSLSESHGAYLGRMVRNQGVTNDLLDEGNDISAASLNVQQQSLAEQWVANELLMKAQRISHAAYEQRQTMIRQAGLTNEMMGFAIAASAGVAIAAGGQRSKMINLQSIANTLSASSNDLLRENIDIGMHGLQLRREANRISIQGNDIALDGNNIALELGRQSFQQRGEMISSLAELLQSNGSLIDCVTESGKTLAHELAITREHLQILMTDMSEGIHELREEEVISRIANLQSAARRQVPKPSG